MNLALGGGTPKSRSSGLGMGMVHPRRNKRDGDRGAEGEGEGQVPDQIAQRQPAPVSEFAFLAKVHKKPCHVVGKSQTHGILTPPLPGGGSVSIFNWKMGMMSVPLL